LSVDFRINVFFCGSGLHYLASERIAATMPTARNILFFYRPFVGDVINRARWNRCEYLPWPRFDPLPGPFGKWRRALENLSRVDDLPVAVTKIRLYAPVIDAEVINYFISYLQDRHPHARLAVSIIPDGLMNVQRHPLKLGKRINQRFQRLRALLTPQLRYYTYSGDRTGADSAIVDEIWVLAGLPHHYPREKVRLLPPLAQPVTTEQSPAKRALVLSQPLLQLKSINADDVEAIAGKIQQLMADGDVQEIWYKAHPRDSKNLLLEAGYRVLNLKEPLETHIARQRYDIIVGVATTTLLLARALSPSSRVVAVGLERVDFPTEKMKQQAIAAFRHTGVEIVSA
jgi:hypothetical protein